MMSLVFLASSAAGGGTAFQAESQSYVLPVGIKAVSPPLGGDERLFYLIAGGLRPPLPLGYERDIFDYKYNPKLVLIHTFFA